MSSSAIGLSGLSPRDIAKDIAALVDGETVDQFQFSATDAAYGTLLVTVSDEEQNERVFEVHVIEKSPH
jgi:hypothetical protein